MNIILNNKLFSKDRKQKLSYPKTNSSILNLENSVIKNTKKDSVFINKNIPFKGQQFKSGYYTDKEIRDARGYLGTSGWESKIRRRERDYSNWFMWNILGEDEECDEHIIRVGTLMRDLELEKAEKLKKERERIEKEKELERLKLEKLKKELELKKSLDKIPGYEEEKECLRNRFVRPVELEKREGFSAPDIFPNGILLTGSNINKHKMIAKLLSEESECKFLEIDPEETPLDTIKKIKQEAKKAKESFGKDSTRTLVFVNQFDKIADADNTRVNAMLKKFMNDCSDNYGVTLVFSSDDPSKIDPIVLAPRRTPIQLSIN